MGRRARERARTGMFGLAVLNRAANGASAGGYLSSTTGSVRHLVVAAVVLLVAEDHRRRRNVVLLAAVLVVGHGDVALDPTLELVEGELVVVEGRDVRREVLAHRLVDLGVEHDNEQVVVHAHMVEDAVRRVGRFQAIHASLVVLDEVEGGHRLRLLELDEVDQVEEPVDEVVGVELLAEHVEHHGGRARKLAFLGLVEVGELVVDARVFDRAEDDAAHRVVGLGELVKLEAGT